MRGYAKLAALAASTFAFWISSAVPVQADRQVLSCVARGGSHTVRMTFDFYPRTCRLYWRELDRFLDVDLCRPPLVKARRPFAGSTDSYLLFDLKSKAFISRFGGVDDRGRCEDVSVTK